MSKIIREFLKKVMIMAFLAFLGGFLFAEGGAFFLKEGDSAFEREVFPESMSAYQSAFEEGIYTEKSLYRLAFMHESLRNYPQAIFFLKKVRQEFGGDLLEEKVVQLMQKNGSSRYLTSDFWPDYYLFFRNFGWVVWSVFLISMFGLVAGLVLPAKRLPEWTDSFKAVFAPLFAVALIVLGHNLFFTPDRAVIVRETAFYAFPSYGAAYEQGSFSQGETVDIVSEEDIWVRVEAKDRGFWIPRRVIERL